MSDRPTLRVERRLLVPAPTEAVWRLVGDFGSLHLWMPGVSRTRLEGEGVGATRRCETVRGPFEERLLEVGPLRCVYEIVSGPLPVVLYRATLEAQRPSPQTCEIVWSARFRAADGVADDVARGAVAAVQAAGLSALARRFGASP